MGELRKRLVIVCRLSGRCVLATVLSGLFCLMWVGATGSSSGRAVSWLERRSYDLPFRLRRQAVQRLESEVTLIEITADNWSALGGGKGPEGGIARSNITRLLERLSGIGPRLIFLDLRLSVSDANSTEDKLLADQIGRTRRLVLVGRANAGASTNLADRWVAPVFEKRAFWVGADDVLELPDETVRMLPGVFVTHVGAAGGSAANAHADTGTNRVAAAWVAAGLLGAPITTNEKPEQIRWLNYYGPGRAPFHHLDYADALAMPLESLRTNIEGRCVLIGDTRLEKGDRFRNPCNANPRDHLPGVDVQGTALMNLLHGHFLRGLWPPAQAILVTLWGLGLGLMLTVNRGRSRHLAAITAGSVLAICSAAAQLGFRVWWIWMIPVVIQWPVALLLASRPVRHLIFISYKSEDGSDQARALVERLKALRIEPYFAPDELKAGSAFSARIRREIRKAPIFLLVLTPKALEDLPRKSRGQAIEPTMPSDKPEQEPWVAKEIREAIERRCRIVSVLAGTGPLVEGTLEKPFDQLEGKDAVNYEKGSYFDEMLRRICRGVATPRHA